MLTYTFSKREKVLLVVLAVIALLIAWFMLIYQNTSNEVTRIDSEIATAKLENDAYQSRVDQMQQMQRSIEQYEAAGARSVEVPEYDNLRPLMAELNDVLARTETYSLSFDDIDLGDDSSSYVNRGVRIDFGCGSYAAAEEVVKALADGSFPCLIDSVSIADNGQRTANRSGGAGTSPFSASAHMTFFERR